MTNSDFTEFLRDAIGDGEATKNLERPLRYTVGQDYPFVRLTTEQYTSLYLPWRDKLLSLEVINLRCAAHHKVAWRHDPEDKKYDGFIFLGADGSAWHNQYPYADYGQLDDSMDWRVQNPDDDIYPRFRDACKYLETVRRGVYQFEHVVKELGPNGKQINPKYALALMHHFEDVRIAVEDATGKFVRMRPVIIRANGDKPEHELPGFFDCTLQEWRAPE